MVDTRPILLIEDNPDDEALTLRAFAKNGVANPVLVARDGVEAIECLFGADPAQPDPDAVHPAVVLLDLKLPRIDGLEVLRRIRADAGTALLPVVILTTSGEPRDIRQAYHLGANSYIRKPVDYPDFVQAVGAIVAYWVKLNEPAE
ncbi:MAG: response regulator [Rhodocyclaceae bacterium]|jgi:two-component system response regulator|nr:response regulator [Rhodocyclaceae bacterium]MCL4757362.1 response regulator [Rhodocyclaceae bacterium]